LADWIWVITSVSLGTYLGGGEGLTGFIGGVLCLVVVSVLDVWLFYWNGLFNQFLFTYSDPYVLWWCLNRYVLWFSLYKTIPNTPTIKNIVINLFSLYIYNKYYMKFNKNFIYWKNN